MKKDVPPHRYDGLQDFLETLERRGRLKRIARPVALKHEITEIHGRVLAKGGPALMFEKPVDDAGRISSIPLVTNLFGTRERIEWGFGLAEGGIGELATLLSELKSPHPPASLMDAVGSLPLLRSALSLGVKEESRPPCQEIVWRGADIDLGRLPVQWCWPGEPAPLVTWPLVITRECAGAGPANVGVYRMQVLGRNRLIMRWLEQRGGAKHFRSWQKAGKDMPVAIAIGADPATILSAVMPLPEDMSELDFAGVLRGRKTRIAPALTQPLAVPANAEIVLEGTVSVAEEADEGPYGDHTGYFNAVERFPVVTLSAITMRKKPVYLSTYTGRPPDEPSVLGEAMTELFIPLVKQQFPEITDIYLPPEACSYRAIVASIDKRYPGQARRVMMGLWSMLSQFNMTKLIIIVDPDINVRRWDDVMWALATRFDASRDTLILESTPVDYLDFASPKPGLGGKLGLDATNKIGPETSREWGAVLTMSEPVKDSVDRMWQELGL
ncbi:UbiD family decarboxylase [Martelella sp. AD-3]|uniref:UbiD family decarboxylase n=1 Tax=Martelella sp. AD-3 TaxID=686597 RepID=UPI0004B6BFB8|nr:UbiD family decarboxylase [Martelella sp. AD-3]AMM85559.1 3-octaprenyl-4-hydroxybenzoate carboxy-lyase [Martelella sp. AD-3]